MCFVATVIEVMVPLHKQIVLLIRSLMRLKGKEMWII